MMETLTFVLDVDGVMTTGQFLYSSLGKEYKVFGPHDNDGLQLIKDRLKVQFITADQRGYPITKKRIVEDMNFELTLVSAQRRFEFLNDYYGFDTLIYMGDGYHDAKILKASMFGIAPKNARKEALLAADYVTESKAAEGAVLDAVLKILDKYCTGD